MDSLKQDIEQLWAEAVVLEQKGYTNYFDDGEMEKNRQRYDSKILCRESAGGLFGGAFK